MTTKKLTRRQARWAEFLSGFNFVIFYTLGKENQKADSLNCWSNNLALDDNNDRQQYQLQILLPGKRLGINTVSEGGNSTLIKNVVKANLEEDYCSKLCHSLKTGQLAKKIDFCHLSDLLVDSRNSLC